MKPLILFLLLSIGSFQYGKSEESLNLQKLVQTFIGKFDSVVGTGTNMQTVFNLIVSGASEESQAIMKDLDTIKNKLKNMDTHISSKLENMENILVKLEKGADIRTMKTDLAVGIQKVDEAWKTLSIYRKNPRATSKGILKSYVDTYDPELKKFIEIQKRIAPTQKAAEIGVESLPVLLAKDINRCFDSQKIEDQLALLFAILIQDNSREFSNSLILETENILPTKRDMAISSDSFIVVLKISYQKKNIKKICGTGAGAQQYLMNLFLIILNAEINATILLTFIGKLRDQDGWSTYKRSLESNFVTRYEAYIREFSKGFNIASREYRSCDPSEGWINGTSYFELEKFNQATMFKAPQDWVWPNSKDCNQRAAEMNRERATRICQSNLVDCYDTKEEVCHGSLTSCIDVKYAERCVLKGQSRRYQWIKANDGADVWGRVQDGCKSGEIVPSNSWPYCICHCIEKQNKVSLEMAASNLHQKRVITAVRFAKKNNIIFIQIKEGKLGPEGTISEHFNEWKPPSPTTDPEKLVTFDSIDNSFNVGDLVGAHNEVLAGVGFTRSEENSGKRLKLQILVIKFQYSTGVILGRRRNITSTAISNDNHVIGNLNSISAITKVDHDEDSLPGHYERFYRTPLTADAGQATVPLFDATPVQGNPVRPLSGVGLFHKGTKKYAGFLSFKAIDVDTAFFFRKYYLNKLNDVAMDKDM